MADFFEVLARDYGVTIYHSLKAQVHDLHTGRFALGGGSFSDGTESSPFRALATDGERQAFLKQAYDMPLQYLTRHQEAAIRSYVTDASGINGDLRAGKGHTGEFAQTIAMATSALMKQESPCAYTGSRGSSNQDGTA